MIKLRQGREITFWRSVEVRRTERNPEFLKLASCVLRVAFFGNERISPSSRYPKTQKTLRQRDRIALELRLPDQNCWADATWYTIPMSMA